ncbi:MAG: sigma-70 family RNA polymerase sigma factor [Polyangiaceae bacterium]|nr:sigma-70 family RNA polymerase sigma factor [Polyangiaceae bacterium]
MTAPACTSPTDAKLDVAEVYERHGEQLWRNLHRLGVPSADLADALQEVLLVVHRRLDSYDPRHKLSTWLYGICVRVASNERRRIRRRREDPLDPTVGGDEPQDSRNPERLTEQRRAQQRLRQLLDTLEPEKRATFVMFELEGATTREIAETMGVPLGTVFSRLSAAREAFRQALDRLERNQREARRVERRKVGT